MTDMEFYFWYGVVATVAIAFSCWLDHRAERRRRRRPRQS